MPWNPSITQLFIRPLIDNLITVLQAGQAATHTEVNDGVAMPAYKVWRRSRWANTLFPACSVIASSSDTVKGEGGPLIAEAHTIEILIEDVGPDPDTLADNVLKRVQAAHLIIERAALSALFAGYLPSRTQRPHWDIKHRYPAFYNELKSQYKQNGNMTITFKGLTEKT